MYSIESAFYNIISVKKEPAGREEQNSTARWNVIHLLCKFFGINVTAHTLIKCYRLRSLSTNGECSHRKTNRFHFINQSNRKYTPGFLCTTEHTNTDTRPAHTRERASHPPLVHEHGEISLHINIMELGYGIWVI